MVKNVKYAMVEEKLSNLIGTMDCCRCERCREDMLALALNNLKPKYVSTEKGELIERANALVIQDEVELTTAVMQAIQKVKAFPRH